MRLVSAGSSRGFRCHHRTRFEQRLRLCFPLWFRLGCAICPTGGRHLSPTAARLPQRIEGQIDGDQLERCASHVMPVGQCARLIATWHTPQGLRKACGDEPGLRPFADNHTRPHCRGTQQVASAVVGTAFAAPDWELTERPKRTTWQEL